MLLRDPSANGIPRISVGSVAIVSAIVGAVLATVVLSFWPQSPREAERPSAAEQPALLPADLNSINIAPQVVELAGIRTATATHPTVTRTLRLRGSLALDVNRLVHVHARFPGQVKELAMIEEPAKDGSSVPKKRTINFMDRVSKGQRLAVLWSKELGETKSELVEARARLLLDRQTLERLRDLARQGATTEGAVRDADKQVELDEIAVNKAENTLRSWLLSDAEIDAVSAAADRIHQHREARDQLRDENWARVDAVAPMSGTIVEKNVAEGNIVDTDTDLFKIADLSVLTAWAHVYEEDLPYLQRLPKPVRWTITINSDPEAGTIPGTINWIGDIIDPNEHMALVAGFVENPRGEYRAGQFITAIVELPPEEKIVEIPTRALVEDGEESIVLVQTDPQRSRYTRRRVAVARRYHDVVHVRSHLTPEQKQDGFEELHEGERVVAAGALELREALSQQQSAPKAGAHP